jgi:hypothetical protein
MGDFRIGAQIFRLPIRPNGYGRTDNLLAFDSPACSGNPFLMLKAAPSLFALAFIAPPGHTLFLPVPDSAPQQFVIRSLFDDRTCVAGPGNEESGFPAQAVLNLDDVFTPPFKLVAVDNNTPIEDHVHIYLKLRNLKDKNAVEALTGSPIPIE